MLSLGAAAAQTGARAIETVPGMPPVPDPANLYSETGAGKLSPAELKKISQKSCGVLSSLGPSVQWIHSYVTADKIYCIYHATDESLVMRHAELGGFPANKISRVATVIDPATAE